MRPTITSVPIDSISQYKNSYNQHKTPIYDLKDKFKYQTSLNLDAFFAEDQHVNTRTGGPIIILQLKDSTLIKFQAVFMPLKDYLIGL